MIRIGYSGWMKRGPKSTLPKECSTASALSEPASIVHIKVSLYGISPIVWRRVLVRSTLQGYE